MLIWLKRLLIILFLLAIGVAGGAYWLIQQPLQLSAEMVDLEVAKGSSTRLVSQQIAAAQNRVPAQLLYIFFRLSGKDTKIKAGSYEMPNGITPQQLLDMLVAGKQATRSVQLIEGWTMRQFRQAIAQAPNLQATSQDLTDQQLMAKLGYPNLAAEGQFFPDTYIYPKNARDLEVYADAFKAMQKRLALAWELRDKDLPLNNQQELLTLASIVEKETATAVDRGLVAGVFINRLRKGMLLQTDPTVIYGVSDAVGKEFDGKIRYSHLRDNNAWNTYVHVGLPPTPIAMPGNASIMAVAQPLKTTALYFVAKGGGQSHFSESLTEHNQAVDKYIRNKPQ